MRRLDQLARGIEKTRLETGLNTRRVQANFPLVERKLDVLTGEQGYYMEFPLTKHSHSTRLTLRVKPDNCCECDPGAQTPTRYTIGYYFQSIIPEGFEDKVDYPAVYASPLIQESGTFNYGYRSPFVYARYTDYVPLGETSINPDGGITIAEDGVYTIYFQAVIGLGNVGGEDSEIIASIRRLTVPDPEDTENDGEVLDLLISKKIYSVYRGNLKPGGHVHHMINLENLNPDTANAWTLRVYAQCVNLKKGDIVGGYIQATHIPNLTINYGWNDLNNVTTINLLGAGYGILIGFVFDEDTQLPLQGATVSYSLGFGGSTTTDEFGAYAFYDLRPATYSVTASKGSYHSQTRDATVYFDKITEMGFNLTHT